MKKEFDSWIYHPLAPFAVMVTFTLAVCASMYFGAMGDKDPDLRREQAKRDAWRLYMEASK